MRKYFAPLFLCLIGCGQHSFDEAVDDVSGNSSSSIQYGVVQGTPVIYEGETYNTVVIGSQTWMARNLNYNVAGSKCYGENGNVYNPKNGKYDIKLSSDEIQANCAKYGRLYEWATAMALPLHCNFNICYSEISEKHKGICPHGWHIPNNADWDKLMRFIDGDAGTDSPYDSETAGKLLKATSGWNDNKNKSGNGTDKYGFAALPGGYGDYDGYFDYVGELGEWWSSNENGSYAYYRDIYHNDLGAYWDYDNKDYFSSIRCLQD